jgi:hypothetical protein
MSEETEPEKTNNKLERSSEEESLDMAKNMLKQGAQIENVVAASGLGRQRVLGLKGSLVKASKRLEAANKRTEAENERGTEIQAENEPDSNIGAGAASSHVVPAPIVTPEAPATFVVRPSLTREEWSRYSKMKVVDLVSEIADLKSQNVSLQGVAQTRRGNGGGHDSYAENPYAQKILQIAEAKELKELLGLGKNDHESEAIKELKLEIRELKQSLQNNPLGFIKLGVDAFKAGTDSASKPQGIDPTLYVSTYRAGMADARENLATANAKSEIDLKLQEMQQSERLDYKKLEYEERRADKKDAADNKKWEFAEKGLKILTSEHAGAAIEAVGASMADKIRGNRVPMTTITCPRCDGRFKTNPQLPHAMCPSCGAMLEKPTEQQPAQEQPSDQPQAETVPSEEPKEQKPKIDITSDEGVKK